MIVNCAIQHDPHHSEGWVLHVPTQITQGGTAPATETSGLEWGCHRKGKEKDEKKKTDMDIAPRVKYQWTTHEGVKGSYQGYDEGGWRCERDGWHQLNWQNKGSKLLTFPFAHGQAIRWWECEAWRGINELIKKLETGKGYQGELAVATKDLEVLHATAMSDLAVGFPLGMEVSITPAIAEWETAQPPTAVDKTPKLTVPGPYGDAACVEIISQLEQIVMSLNFGIKLSFILMFNSLFHQFKNNSPFRIKGCNYVVFVLPLLSGGLEFRNMDDLTQAAVKRQINWEQ
ncbi:hypothetical protein BYT27DRAFT_7217776 [Phlegmacium glaucopus]|nr:hypothetical protein BYT27DRAFT_7217776 [Phlegmacium glaucopus]